jgi:zinc protease
MSIRRTLPLLAVLVSLAACASLGLGRGPAPTWAHEASDLPPDPAVVYGRLDNGLRYAILENDTPTGAGALRLRIDAGSLYEEDDQRGLAHLLEHMAFNGSEHVEEGEMVRMLERAGLEFGPDTNAYTSLDETVYMLDLPATDEETLEVAFFLMGEVADNLSIDPDALERERGVVLSEMRVRNTYSQRYQDAAQAFLYDGARFTTRSPIGTEEVLRTAPAERVRALYEAYYRPERALVVFVGDAPAEGIEARIRETFGEWTVAGAPGGEPELGSPTPRELEADLFVDPDMPTVVTISTSTSAPPFVDTVAARRDRLVRSLGFAMLSRRFQALARAEEAPFISASASYGRLFDTLETANVSLIAETGKWDEAIAAGEQELRRALEHGFSAAEFEEQIVNLRASLQAATEGAATRGSSRLSNALAGALGGDTVFTHPSSDLERFEAFAAEVDVAQIDAAFRAAWGDAEPVIFMGAREPPAAGAEALVAAYEGSLLVAVEGGDDRALDAFAYEDFGPAGVVAEENVVEDLGLTRVRFANNVRLNVKPTDFADDRVHVEVRVGSGRLELPRAQPGLEMLADSAFTSGGLEAHTLDELQSLLAGRNVGLSFYTGDDAFVFSAVATPADLALQLKLFAAYVAAPGYRSEALTRFRRSLPAWYDSLDSTPIAVQSRDVPPLLRSGDERFGVPPQGVLESRTLEELAAALAPALGSGPVEIGIVGDVTVEDAVAAVASSFGGLPERAAAADAFRSARAARFHAPTERPITLTHAGESDRALALVYWPATDDSDRTVTRAITLAKEVLQLKLTERVREAEGATYSPSAFASFSGVSPDFGYVGASLDIEPALVEGYFDTVDELVAAMAAGEVSEDELTRARTPILADIRESLESNGYWLNLITTAQSAPRYLEDHRTREAGYAGITREDVVAAARRYLRPERAVRIAIVPEPEVVADSGDQATR